LLVGDKVAAQHILFKRYLFKADGFAQPLQAHRVQQVVHLWRDRAKPVMQLLFKGLQFGFVFQLA
jgi:hypothetical protein